MKTTTKLAAAFVALAGLTGAALSAQADSRWQAGSDDTQLAHGGYGMQGHRSHGEHQSEGHGRHHGEHHGEGRGGYRGDGHGERHGMHGGGRRGGHMFRMMESFDTNEDGTLSQEEIDQTRGERFSAFDGDGDQSLSLAEYERLWLDAMREAMVDRFQHLDADGDAQVTAEEFKRPFAKTVRRMDRNEDGVIDRDDFGPRHAPGEGSRMAPGQGPGPGHGHGSGQMRNPMMGDDDG